MAQPSSFAQYRLERNCAARERLEKVLGRVFPVPVAIHAQARRFIPTTPRLAVDSYWRTHPLRADRLARALARQAGAPGAWTWRLSSRRKDGLPTSFRTPPAPYRERAFSLGPGFCCVCGRPVYRFGWHMDLWDAGPNRNATWHAACVTAWSFWNAPSEHVRLLRRGQSRRCAETGGRLWKNAEIDHRVPLFRVWGERREEPWPVLLGYWGAPNLQVINREVHVAKCSDEAGYRRELRAE